MCWTAYYSLPVLVLYPPPPSQNRGFNLQIIWSNQIRNKTTTFLYWKISVFCRSYPLHPISWLSPFLGRGPTPSVCSDQSRSVWLPHSWMGHCHTWGQTTTAATPNFFLSTQKYRNISHSLLLALVQCPVRVPRVPNKVFSPFTNNNRKTSIQ